MIVVMNRVADKDASIDGNRFFLFAWPVPHIASRKSHCVEVVSLPCECASDP